MSGRAQSVAADEWRDAENARPGGKEPTCNCPYKQSVFSISNCTGRVGSLRFELSGADMATLPGQGAMRHARTRSVQQSALDQGALAEWNARRWSVDVARLHARAAARASISPSNGSKRNSRSQDGSNSVYARHLVRVAVPWRVSRAEKGPSAVGNVE